MDSMLPAGRGDKAHIKVGVVGRQRPVPAKARNLQRLLLGGGPSSISSVMPVRWMISGLRMRPGDTKGVEAVGDLPVFSTTAPISMMTSYFLFRPVVSMSKQTISSEKRASVCPWTTTRSSTSLM